MSGPPRGEPPDPTPLRRPGRAGGGRCRSHVLRGRGPQRDAGDERVRARHGAHHFALALPVLAVGLVTSIRGSVWGRAALIGALGYLTYNATLLVYATPFNELFLAYVALLGLSLWSLVSALLDPCRSWRRATGCPRAASPRSS
jgi:hypothetical protein